MDDDRDAGDSGWDDFAAPPNLVSLTPFSPYVSPSPRRISSNFAPPSRPVAAAKKKLAWVSLQGRLVGVEEASSARTIGGGLSPQEAVAWELFSPIHRVLIVAVVAVAAAQSKKNRQILQLQKSVHLRDQVLLSMQQKLDNLCEQVSNMKDQPEIGDNSSLTKNMENGCWLCDKHRILSNDLKGNSDEVFKYKMPPNEAEQEERRMSDLSDWALSSVTSASELQMNGISIEQDICNMKRECEEKNATIKELSTFLHSSNIASSKRIAELEDMIRRKNQIIKKLRKDMVVLEQKVVHLTRLRRPSFSAPSSSSSELPFMAENIIYDMDSTTSPSSSDSDCPPKSRPQTPVTKVQEGPVGSTELSSKRTKSAPEKASNSLPRPSNRHAKPQPGGPLKEKSLNQRSDSVPPSKPKKVSDSGDLKTVRRRAQTRMKEALPPRKWI
ncbi:uncharacterized protein LOC131147893 [Malania oleifera]|uniref:uncharacterized protein LOC131147893 n=1 Tax=Malania oleifera TaxID=397392 RepID=UPI0025AE6E56|nr:uncharacterized protein LOC131147893 [Malania oleifera]